MGKLEQIRGAVKGFVAPESYVAETIPWVGELKLSKDNLLYIAEVRRNSEKLKKEYREEVKFAGIKLKEVPDIADRKTAFDLVELHLMMGRELQLPEFSHQRVFLQKEIERKADEIIDYILKYAEHTGSYLNYNLEKPVERLKAAKTLPEKLTAITRYLNSIHYGGNHNGMDIFPGYPRYTTWPGKPRLWNQKDIGVFLTILSNL